MKILMLAWRDMQNPLKGGAEIVTDIYLKELAKMGHEVTLFTASYNGAKPVDSYHGYEIIRKGGRLGVYLHGFNYASKYSNQYDLIIDQVNTLPFFTPLCVPKSKRVAYFHQLCLNVWFSEFPKILSPLGYLFERIYLKIYKNTKCLVVSKSTANDLIKYAGCDKDNVLVLDNQIDFKVISRMIKKEKGSFCFCGRLTPSKRVHDCIKAIAQVPNSKLYIIGDGKDKYKKALKKLIKSLRIEDRVIFTGRLSFSERNKLMSKCEAILVTSIREGWGLIVTEANANGILAITYDIEGLRDANKHGIICKKNNIYELALEISKVMTKYPNNKLNASMKFAKEHSDWQKQIIKLEKWLKNH